MTTSFLWLIKFQPRNGLLILLLPGVALLDRVHVVTSRVVQPVWWANTLVRMVAPHSKIIVWDRRSTHGKSFCFWLCTIKRELFLAVHVGISMVAQLDTHWAPNRAPNWKPHHKLGLHGAARPTDGNPWAPGTPLVDAGLDFPMSAAAIPSGGVFLKIHTKNVIFWGVKYSCCRDEFGIFGDRDIMIINVKPGWS